MGVASDVSKQIPYSFGLPVLAPSSQSFGKRSCVEVVSFRIVLFLFQSGSLYAALANLKIRRSGCEIVSLVLWKPFETLAQGLQLLLSLFSLCYALNTLIVLVFSCCILLSEMYLFLFVCFSLLFCYVGDSGVDLCVAQAFLEALSCLLNTGITGVGQYAPQHFVLKTKWVSTVASHPTETASLGCLHFRC